MPVPTIHYPEQPAFYPVTVVLSGCTVRVVIHSDIEDETTAIYRFADKRTALRAFNALEAAEVDEEVNVIDRVDFWMIAYGAVHSDTKAQGAAS